MSSSYIVICVILVVVGIACIIVDKKDKNKKQAEKQALNERLEIIENRLKLLEINEENSYLLNDNNEE